jgi:hydrogenase expression/formation protein HypC
MKIVSIDGDRAEVESAGIRRAVGLALLPEARVGDEVLVHAGYAISVVDPDEAEETRRLIQQAFDASSDEGS